MKQGTGKAGHATKGKGREVGARAPVDARGAAVGLLAAVLGRRQMLSDLLVAPDGPLAALDPAGRARAQRLALAALRQMARSDAVLAPLLRKPPPDPVRQILRLALAEHFVEGAPAHAVVNWAVGAVRHLPRMGHLSGLVNAVLRRAFATTPQDWAALPVPMLPRWLRQPLVREWGRAAVGGIEAAHLAGAAVDLTLKDSAGSDGMAAALGAEVLPTGSLRLPRGGAGRISALPGYGSGDWWVQDAAAALPARLLAKEAAAGARIIDLCAAPGGKTLQLAAMGADVTAVDISAPRLARLSENLARTGLEATAVAADALQWAPPQAPAAVLLDAPCSATGTIRRHPDLPHVRDMDALPPLLALQAALIDRALGWLRPGGVLVYCTCSLLPDEGEAQARAALARHDDLQAEPILPQGADPAWQTAEGGLRLRPDHWVTQGGLDGFYMIRFRKRGGV